MKLSQTAIYPVFVVFSVMIYGANIPGNFTNVGFMFFYPIYGTVTMLTLFTTGTWQVIYMLEWLMRKESDKMYNEKVFKFFTEGSLLVYLCHDLWITVIATFVIYPLTD